MQDEWHDAVPLVPELREYGVRLADVNGIAEPVAEKRRLDVGPARVNGRNRKQDQRYGDNPWRFAWRTACMPVGVGLLTARMRRLVGVRIVLGRGLLRGIRVVEPLRAVEG